MGKFNEYTQKTTPADNDTMMIYDAAAKANKLSPFSGIWNWIVGKLTNAVISNLQTSNKSVIGALNELYSKPLMTENTDLNNASGGFTILRWKLQTANTPRTEELTTASSGIVLSYIESANWAVQFGMIPADKKWYVRVKSNGEWSRWEEKSSNPFLRYERTYGTSLTVSNVRGATHGLILIGYTLIPFYISGSSTSGYTIATPQLPDGISVSNNGRAVTITTKAAQVITIIYPYME